MAVEDLLAGQRTEIVDEALAALGRSRQVHYDRSGEKFAGDRIAELVDVVITALRDRQLEPVARYCEAIANQRFDAGFGIAEVQTAFNVVEETMWRHVVLGTPPEELAEALGLVGTIIGFGKDALARRYVSLASQRHVPTLDLTALFQGAEN